ncbi:hypothetical protein N2152v2_006223 [Parachlorella kessleri]
MAAQHPPGFFDSSNPAAFYMFDEELLALADSCWVVEGVVFPVHRAVVALRSPVFRSAYLLPAESSAGSQDGEEGSAISSALFAGYTSKQVALLLQYIYHPQDTTATNLGECAPADLPALAHLAHRFDVAFLLAKVENHLAHTHDKTLQQGSGAQYNNGESAQRLGGLCAAFHQLSDAERSIAAALLPPADEILKWCGGPQGLQDADVAWLLWRSLHDLTGSLPHGQQTAALSYVVQAPWVRLHGSQYQEHVWDVCLGSQADACRLVSPPFKAGSYDWQLVLDSSPGARHAHVAVQVCGSQGLPAQEKVLAASRVTVVNARNFESSLFFPVDLQLLQYEAPEKPVINLNTTFSTLSSQGWLALAFTALAFGLMVTDLVGADFVMNLTLALMVIFKLITIKNALAGFASNGLMTVVVLFMVAQGITSSGGADYIITKLLGTPRETSLAQVRMCLITVAFSSFVNNTPVFCIMLPIVLTWAAKARVPARQLLIPLSYCALLGGTNTEIGTSTNLVVTGLFNSRVLDPKSQYYQPGVSAISMFDITPYGIPNAIWGIIYVVLAAPFLLNDGAGKRVFASLKKSFRKTQPDGPADLGAEFYMGLLVTEGSPVVGNSIRAAGLRSIDGQFVVAVRHKGKVVHAVGPEFVLSAGDVLFLSGIPDGTHELATKFGLVPYTDALEELDAGDLPGLAPAFGATHLAVPRTSISSDEEEGDKLSKGSSGNQSPREAGHGSNLVPTPPELIEVTVRKGSDIVGKTIRQAAFSSRFHAAIVSVKRDNVALGFNDRKMGDEVAGDQLLLSVGPHFWTEPGVTQAFTHISKGGQVRTHNEFMLPMRVTGFLAGKSVHQAGLRMLPNAFLVALERRGTTITVVAADEILERDDLLWFAADASAVRFIRNTPGLVPLAERQASKLADTRTIERRLVQAIVAQGSPLADKTVREVRFREHFNAAVLAVARNGDRIQANPGDVRLKAGDILLLDTGGAFVQRHKQSKYFSLVYELEGTTNPPRYLHTFVAIASIATAFILYALEILDILPGAVVVVAVLLLSGCMSPDQARRSIKWDIYLMIAGSFGVSACLENTGAAAAIANLFIEIGKRLGGDGFVIAAVYLATTIISQIIANNAAAAIVFPIAATISKNDSIDIYILAYAVMLGASSVFSSSFGYQTNLMALAAGSYSSRDFLKFGTPMQVVVAVVCIINLATQKWQVVWVVTAIVGTVVMGTPQVLEWVTVWRDKKTVLQLKAESKDKPALATP